MRTRCAALIEMDGGFALMHRLDVKPDKENPNKPYGEYYVFPGGGLEDNETLEEATKREVLEEFGIDVIVEEQLFYREIREYLKEYIFKCKYISGKLGTGNGPEFSGDAKYINRGKYIPEIIKKEEIKNIRLLPEELKKQLVDKIEKGLL